MDNTTKWLIRGAAAVVIAGGLFGVFWRISYLNEEKQQSKKETELLIRRMREKGEAARRKLAFEACKIKDSRYKTPDQKLGPRECVDKKLKEAGSEPIDWSRETPFYTEGGAIQF